MTQTVPVVSGGNTAYWIDENGLKTASDPTFEQMTLTAYKLVVKTLVSDELLADSNPAVDDVLMDLFALAIIRGEETAFLRGTGLAGDPITGIYNTAGISTLPYSGDLSDDLADLIGAVEEDEGEVVSVLHALREKRKLRKIKDDNGQYIYQQPGVKGFPATIWDANAYGDKYIPSNLGVGANESFAIAGDFSYAYIGDRSGLVIDVSKERYFEYDQTCFRGVKRVGFRIADASKFARLTGITMA
jgi:HK97 family phage major capsid protein